MPKNWKCAAPPLLMTSTDLGLDADWAARAVTAVGNYGEMFDRNLGAGSKLLIERGLNAQWDKGGILYAPPVR
jgi:general L-amino acid transport system substrate-binding protein